MKKFLIAAAAALSFVGAAEAATITKSGDTITYTGESARGDYYTFKKLFTSEVKHIRLKSDGGVWYDAQMIAKLISGRKDVATSTFGDCASACSLIWLSADKHYFGAGRVGFHMTYIPNRNYHKNILSEYGWNGVEYTFKDAAMEYVVDMSQYIDNPAAIVPWLRNVRRDGLMPRQMYWASQNELVFMEGAFQTAPTPKAKEVYHDGKWGSYFVNTGTMWVTEGSYMYNILAKNPQRYELKIAFNPTSTISSYSNYNWTGATQYIQSYYKSGNKYVVKLTVAGKARMQALLGNSTTYQVTLGITDGETWGALTFRK